MKSQPHRYANSPAPEMSTTTEIVSHTAVSSTLGKKLLKEIINWAIDFAKYGSVVSK